MQIVTYKISNSVESFDVPDWLAFIVLPTGKLWDVRFSGATEEKAKQKAIALWESEFNKLKPEYIQQYGRIDRVSDDPWFEIAEKQHHLAGKIWMIHKETRDKIRIPLTEISMYEQRGYERGGPRSK